MSAQRRPPIASADRVASKRRRTAEREELDESSPEPANAAPAAVAVASASLGLAPCALATHATSVVWDISFAGPSLLAAFNVCRAARPAIAADAIKSEDSGRPPPQANSAAAASAASPQAAAAANASAALAERTFLGVFGAHPRLFGRVTQFLPTSYTLVALPRVCRGLRALVRNPQSWIRVDCDSLRRAVNNSKLEVLCAGLWHEIWGISLFECVALHDDALRPIGMHCRGLRAIDVTGCCELSNESLGEIGGLRCLEVLNLTGCILINDRGLELFASVHQGSLRVLNLWGLTGVTDAGMRQLLARTPRLLALDATWCKQLSEGTCDALARCCPELEAMLFTWSETVSDPCVHRLAQVPGLQFLDLDGCSRVSDVGLSYFVGHQRLRVLKARFLCKATNASIGKLARACPELALVDVRQCDNINDNALLEEIAIANPRMQVLL